MFFFHFLMMTTTLLRLSGFNKFGHTRKYSIHSPQASVQKMAVKYLQKPMISLVLFQRPVAELLIWVFLFLCCTILDFLVFIFIIFFII